MSSVEVSIKPVQHYHEWTYTLRNTTTEPVHVRGVYKEREKEVVIPPQETVVVYYDAGRINLWTDTKATAEFQLYTGVGPLTVEGEN